ncbi:nucleotide sugar dehydrogenase [bacterium]|nr:nucleotide sugar dehydrogenase [bacterium]
MKKISLIGIGKLGLCLALTLEKSGYDVLGCDVNEDYVKLINSKTFQSDEQGVNELLIKSKNFRATTNLQECHDHSDMLFVLVATPSLPNGKYDHSQVDRVINNVLSLERPEKPKHFVICCTTMPGYCDEAQSKLEMHNYIVSYNPEFIAQGTIIRDQARPDMVLIGEGSAEAGDLIQEIYEKSTLNEPTFNRMSLTEAEICKISLNCFLTTKISFANMIGDIARFSGCRPDPILKAIGTESRISPKYLGYGYGYGGPCFPRDNRALAIYAGEKGVEAKISLASDEFNKIHLEYQVELFKRENSTDKPVVFDYVTYKPESTMLVESQQLLFAKELAENGYTVIVKERESVIQEVKEIYGDLFLYKRSEK